MSLLQRALLKRHEDNRANPHVVTAAQAAYDSAVSGFAPTTAAAALDSLAGVRIMEMGENENGRYVRWENGLQVCWAIMLATRFGTSLIDVLWYYPAVFAETPTVSALPGNPAEGAPSTTLWAGFGPMYVGSHDNARIGLNIRGTNIPEDTQVRVLALAIGRWKE